MSVCLFAANGASSGIKIFVLGLGAKKASCLRFEKWSFLVKIGWVDIYGYSL